MFKRLILILCLLAGWGSAAWADRFEPTFEASYSLTSTSWYYFKFENSNAFLYSKATGENFSYKANETQNPAFMWQLVGTSAEFRLVSLSGQYAKWNGSNLAGTDDASQAATFRLIDGTDADSYAVQKSDASGTSNCLNPQSSIVTTYSRDNGCRVRFSAPAAADLAEARDIVLTNAMHVVNLVFQDADGNALSGDTKYVKYTPASGTPIELSPNDSPHDFDGGIYRSSAFCALNGYVINAQTFDADSDPQVLTFTIAEDPNLLHFSSASENGEWAEDTKWFTWRNNRPTGSANNPPYRYVSTSKYFVNNHFYIGNSCQDDATTDRGGVWCFVGDKNGFQIQNAAYGPDFVFAYVNNNSSTRYEMVLKDEVPVGATTTFTYVAGGTAETGLPSSNFLDGANYGYVFRIGTEGNNQVHSNVNGLVSWDGGGSLRLDDGGSVFKITAVSDAELEALQAYDVYRVNNVGITGYSNIAYGDESITFGRRSTAKNGDFLIVKAGTALTPADFNVTPSSDFDVVSVASSDDATHYYKHLQLETHDVHATDAYTIVVTNGTADAYDVDGVQVNYYGANHKNGQTIYTRPTSQPRAIDFKVSGADDKFIWGPVIDKKSKTVTFDIRDRAKAFHTGLYQLCLKGEDNIATVNNFITKFDENINTASNYLYLAPSIYKEDNAVFKYTGVPNYAEEPTSYIYIEESGEGTVNISAAGGASISNLAYSFDEANGEITFTGYGINGYTKQDNQKRPIYEPREMPSFVSGTGPTTYALTPISMTDYDAYRISYAGTYNNKTRVHYGKATPTGISDYGKDDLFIVSKGYTSFLPADFAPTDARCTSVEIVSSPTESTPGELRLTLDLPAREFTVKITGAAATDADRVLYKSKQYATGSTITLTGSTVNPTSIKTNVTDRFVWGPVIDEDFHTITFDIRPLATTLDEGFYQLQLLDDSKIANVNTRINNRKGDGNINTASSYIYLMPYQTEKTDANARILKYNGVPSYAEEPATYIHISKDGDNIQLQSVTGHYTKNNRADTHSDTPTTQTYNFNSGTIWFPGWVIESTWSSTDNNYDQKEGPSIAFSGSNNHEQYYITKVDPTTLYDVYKIDLAGTNQNSVRYVGPDSKGISVIYNGGYLFLAKGTEVAAHEFSFGKTMFINSITVSDDNVITFNVSSLVEGCTNMIVHRQHDVYDRLEAVSDDLLPDDNHIQRGGGMIPQPYVKDFAATVTLPNPNFNSEEEVSESNPETITRTYYANDRHMQNTSVFRVTQYVKPGTSTECVLPFTKNKENGSNNASGHVAEYQRWYDYTTERCFSDDILSLPDFYKFTNGLCNFGVNDSGNVERLTGVVGKTNITLPKDQKELFVAVDASEFQDYTKDHANDNLIEPSLNMRVIYHIVSAHEMAKQLATSGDTWFEQQEYIVPNVKRGNDTYKNNADLIPLTMPWTNYWIYKTAGAVGTAQADAQLMPLAVENADVNDQGKVNDAKRNAAYDHLISNLKFVVEGTATDGRPMSDYIDAGVFHGRPGNVGQAPFINSNHHIYYKIKGSGGTRVVPAGSQAVIKVYAKDGAQGESSPLYQLAKFTLNFQADTDPITITDVIGNPASTRSVDYFVSKNYAEVASMTFQQKEKAFTKINNHRNDNNEPRTYAFPIDFERTSYGYSPNYTFGNYSVTRQGWGIKYQPVALYERNIKNPASTSMDITDDYFFYIDASETPGQVAAVKFDGDLCPGSRLYCYGWLGSGNVYNGSDDATGANVVLRLLGIKKETVDGVEKEEEYVLASYLPGQLTDVAYDSKGNEMRSLSYGRTPSMEPAIYMTPDARQVGVWNSIGFSFTLGNQIYDRYEMRILNNCISTAGGDYSLDDFRIFAAPPKARVDYIAPVCYDHVPLTNVVMPRNAVKEETGDANGMTNVCYCFLDKEKYYGKLDELCKAGGENYKLTNADYNTAFTYALIGNGTNEDSETMHRSFWNVQAACTDAAYNAYTEYDFSKIISRTDEANYPITGVYRQTTGSTEEIVFSTDITKAEGWEPNHDYLIALALNHVNGHYSEVGTNNFGIHSGKCSALDEFRLKPSLTINSDLPELTVTPPSACEGQVSTISVDMHGYGPIGSVVLKNLAYDWWVGYGKPNETAPVVKADVHNFEQQRWPDDESGVYLRNALDHFRAFYPDAYEAESYAPKTGEVAGQTVEYTQAEKDCILHFLKPGANGRVPLILGSRILNINTIDADAVVEEDGKKYIYFTVLPIRPQNAYDPDEDVIFCPDPQQGKILVEEHAPKMIDGFTGMHSMYPVSMTNVPIRMGLRQIDAVRLSATGTLGDHHLRVPLRGIFKSPGNKDNAAIFIDKHKRKQTAATEAQSYNDFLTLVYTDDPLYAERMIQEVDEYGNMQLITVGRVHAYNAPTTGEAHMEIGFARDFRPREGYVYTLKAFFEENVDADETAYKSCPGSLIFDLKVVPEYAQWTAAEGNTDWTNDGNWARADRDVLHADNPTSTRVAKGDAAHPFNGYQTNTANYSSDPRYNISDDASAHVFTPMYFTNVLMHDAELSAPEMYPHTAPVAPSNFLGGLKAETATKLIEYDMLVTPISETGTWKSGPTMTPLALAQRYGKYDCNFGCELFWSNVCDGLTFEPGTAMYDAQHLLYNRAWVEYELDTKRWYTLASPLKETYAGEWYSPEAGGRQLTPHFAPVTFNPAINDRFNPAYYQRSWDKAGKAWIYRMKGDNGTYLGFEHDYEHATNVRVQKPVYLTWGYVYNDVTVPYSNGGFSVKVQYTNDGKDASGKALVRMPKDDAFYDYYQSQTSAGLPAEEGSGTATQDGNQQGVARPDGQGGVYVGDHTAMERTVGQHHRLMSDDLAAAGSLIRQNIENASPSNPYFLVGNPFMAPMNMEKFFAEQTCVRNGVSQPTFVAGKYWILEGTKQDVSMKVGDTWISTGGTGGYVAPLQGFFVQMPTDADGNAILPDANPTARGVNLSFSADVQHHLSPNDRRPALKAPRRGAEVEPSIFRITATNGNQMESNAVVYFSDNLSNRYDAREDAETLLDGNIADKVSTVFTVADEQALQINSMSTSVSMIPVGVVAPKDDTRTTLTFSGISTLEAVMDGMPHLYDADNDTFTVLDEDTAITVTGTTVGRFFIVCGTSLPISDEAEENVDGEPDGKVYNLHGIRVATPQHGTVTIRGSRKEYSK